MPVSWEWLSHRLVKLTGGRDENRLTKILLLKENKHVLYIFWNTVYNITYLYYCGMDVLTPTDLYLH